jgi:hypothetical protein
MEVTAVKEGDTRLYRVIGAVIMAMALAGTLGACGAGQQAPTSVQVTATGGTEGRVGSMIVRDAKIVSILLCRATPCTNRAKTRRCNSR